jgi:trans-aconitate 2-methyltransferase
MSNVAKYYDGFSDRQQRAGINLRHKSVLNWLKAFGLKSSDRLLEIGCGIGTVTELLCETLSEGQVVANDLSEKSIEIAKKNLSRFHNVTCFAGDFLESTVKGTFDVVLLPDVIEHIPIDQHAELFKRIASVLKPEGMVVIHIPDPYFLAWRHTQESQKNSLQIIDQSIYTDELVKAVYPAGLYIEHLQSYSLHVENNDYQIIRLRKLREKSYPPVNRKSSIANRVLNKIKRSN